MVAITVTELPGRTDRFADDGKAKRAAAEEELQKMEADLKSTLAAASARKDGVGANAGESVPS